jgi:hypothetical protein
MLVLYPMLDPEACLFATVGSGVALHQGCPSLGVALRVWFVSLFPCVGSKSGRCSPSGHKLETPLIALVVVVPLWVWWLLP